MTISSRDFLLNVLLYFLIAPLAYMVAGTVTDPHLRESVQYFPLLYVFTIPVWFLAAIVIPAEYLIQNRPSPHVRRNLAIAGALILGVFAAVFERSVMWTLILAAGGAVYGALFRVGRRNTVTEIAVSAPK